MLERLRAIPESFSGAIVESIDERLRALCVQEQVTIPLAIESGSRAWGFPSPDSDYDCRFIYVRRLDDYLSPWPRRDVLETPLDHIFDVNGWDLGKAIKLLLKGNAVVIEWLMSPAIYSADPFFRQALIQFAERYAHRDLVGRHYLHLGAKQRRAYFGDANAVPMKKLFYALRPAAALRWLRAHPDAAVAPMHFPTLMEGCGAPEDVLQVVEEMMAAKAITKELGATMLPDAVGRFIDEEYAAASLLFEGRAEGPPPEALDAAEHLFRSLVRRYDRI